MTRRLRHVDNAFSLIASVSGILFGHALVFPVAIANMEVECTLRLAAVGLISVDPDQQGRGIGRTLLNEAVRECKIAGYDGVVVAILDDFWREAGFEDSRPYNLYFEHAMPTEPISGICWLTEPKRVDVPTYLDYPDSYDQEK